MIPIVFSTDHNFVMPTGVCICSMLLSAEATIYDIYILASPDVTGADRELLERQVKSLSRDSKITFVDMGDKFKDGFQIRQISTACYYRMMIPWLLPHLDKVIYCDGDIIINTPLSDLFGIDMDGLYVAGSIPSDDIGWFKMKGYFDKIGLDCNEYVNSGVLVINSRLQREAGLDKEYDRLSKKKFHYQDQDIINLVCKGKIAHFDCRYNLAAPQYGLIPRLADGKVLIHYAGDKPWKCFTYAWSQWWSAYEKSLFKDDRFYHLISSKILNPKDYFLNLSRKGKHKIQQLMSKYIH